jgi:GTP-binding protein EngB required for normal cell division
MADVTDSADAPRYETAKAVAGQVAKVGGSALLKASSYISSSVSSYVAQGRTGGGPAADVPAPQIADDGVMRGLGSSELLKVASTLDGIFSGGELSGAAGELKHPEVPRLVVVGTQSSGKSSLLNGIMGADILPLGEQMVTRAPLSLQLVHSPDPAAMRAEFGDFSDGVWRVEQNIPLACPDPTAAQLGQIRGAIEAQTDARAGSQKGVSDAPIFLRLHSPHVPNLSLVDLPGLTMTALTAQGQPKDIKEQIRKMVAAYIEPARTIILMVCPARADLEADPAVELCREYDPSGARTVGVLTKVDLMNAGTDVSRYLTNNVPSDLQLGLGYFACKMRGPAESRATVREGFVAEQAYFGGHPVYGRASSSFSDRLGVPPLTVFLSRVLIQHLRTHMPTILQEVQTLYSATERRYAELGPAVPPDDASRSALVQSVVASFCREFVGSLVEKRADIKTGRRIKDAFQALTASLKAVQPFNPHDFTDEYLLEAVRDCEGNHLSFPIPPIELVEHMVAHPEKRPVRQLLPPCLSCLSDVHEELRALSRHLLQAPQLLRFPKLQARLREEVEGLLDRERAATQAKLEDLIEMEEAYVYTDDPSFLSELSAAVKKLVSRLDAPLLRTVLTAYFETVARAITNAAPKAIMLHLVRASQHRVYTALFETLGRQPPEGLLAEPPEMDAKRRADVDLLAKLRAAKRALETLA